MYQQTQLTPLFADGDFNVSVNIMFLVVFVLFCSVDLPYSLDYLGHLHALTEPVSRNLGT